MPDLDRNWQRLLRRALIASLFLHLLSLLLIDLFYTPPEPPPVVYRVRLPPLADFSPPQQLHPLAPVPSQMPSLHTEEIADFEGPGPAPLYEEEGLAEGPAGGLPGISGLFSDLAQISTTPPKPLDFTVPELPAPPLDSLAIEKMRQDIEDRERYTRFHLFDADTTDEESRRRSRARQIVERAIAAMGGRAALAKIREMKAKVWIEATEHCIPGVNPPPGVPPYAYPVAIWQYTGQGTFSNERIKVKISLDPAVPNELYVFRNPCITLSKYYRLFDSRWSFPPPPAPQVPQEVRELQKAGKLREQGEAARWHFIDRFLGEGVIISYVGAEQFEARGYLRAMGFEGKPVDIIRVDDERYGHLYEAFFDRETGLLLAVREGLTPAEQQWYMQTYRRTPPVWTTLYENYKPAHGVLTPHRLVRSTVIVHLKIAYNGEEPDPSMPDIEK